MGNTLGTLTKWTSEHLPWPIIAHNITQFTELLKSNNCNDLLVIAVVQNRKCGHGARTWSEYYATTEGGRMIKFIDHPHVVLFDDPWVHVNRELDSQLEKVRSTLPFIKVNQTSRRDPS